MAASLQSRDRAESPLLQRGAPIGRYLVLGLVGRGAMGDVYAAYDPELDRKVAVKLLHVADGGMGPTLAEQKARLLREAQAIARLSHPNVVVVHDVGSFEDQVFVAMEFVDGHTRVVLAARGAAQLARDRRRLRGGGPRAGGRARRRSWSTATSRARTS